MFDLDKINTLPAEEKAKAEQGIRDLLRSLQAQREDSRDGELVWIENAAGVRDVIDYGYYRRYIMKNIEDGYRLLDPDEIEEEEAKAAQAAVVREEKKKLWNLLTLNEKDQFGSPSDADMRTLQMVTAGRDQFSGMSMEEMSKRMLELEEQLAGQQKKKKDK